MSETIVFLCKSSRVRTVFLGLIWVRCSMVVLVFYSNSRLLTEVVVDMYIPVRSIVGKSE
jgi:hypothetical protein